MAEIQDITGKITIDFEILQTYDPKKILVADVSQWKHIEDKISIVEVTLPGNDKPIVLYWQKNKINVFNSQNLGYTCDAIDYCDMIELPDGIYKITVKGSPDKFQKTRWYLRDVKARLALDKQLINEGMDFIDIDKEKLKNLQYIRMLLLSAEANARYECLDKANYYLTQAQKKIDNLERCKTCK